MPTGRASGKAPGREELPTMTNDCAACDALPAKAGGELCPDCAAWCDVARRETEATPAGVSLASILRAAPELADVDGLAACALSFLCDRGELVLVGGTYRVPSRSEPSKQPSEPEPETTQATDGAAYVYRNPGPRVTERPTCKIHGSFLTPSGRCRECQQNASTERKAREAREKDARGIARATTKGTETMATETNDQATMGGEHDQGAEHVQLPDVEPCAALVVSAGVAPLSTEHAAQAEQARAAVSMFARAAMSANTRKQYEKEARYFAAWATAAGLNWKEPATVKVYLAHLATAGGRKASGVNVARAAIVKAYELSGLPSLADDPELRAMMRGVRSALAIERPATQARGIDPDTLRAMVESLTGAYVVLGRHAEAWETIAMQGARAMHNRDLRARLDAHAAKHGVSDPFLAFDCNLLAHVDYLRFLRDRALILVSFATGGRRSEVCGPRGIRAENVRFNAKGMTVKIPVSKTDQTGKGLLKGVHLASDPAVCPVRALQAWLDASGIKRGPVFVRLAERETVCTLRARVSAGEAEAITPVRAVQLIKESYERATGESSGGISGHSMRRGIATAVAEQTGDVLMVRRVTGHKSTAMAARYVEEADVMRANPLAGIL